MCVGAPRSNTHKSLRGWAVDWAERGWWKIEIYERRRYFVAFWCGWENTDVYAGFFCFFFSICAVIYFNSAAYLGVRTSG